MRTGEQALIFISQCEPRGIYHIGRGYLVLYSIHFKSSSYLFDSICLGIWITCKRCDMIVKSKQLCQSVSVCLRWCDPLILRIVCRSENSLNIFAFQSNSGDTVREGINEKKTFSFGHCLNYLTPPPPPMTQIRATWSSFFRKSKFKI